MDRMHPDVPEWARDVIEREMTDVHVESCHVLKDSPLEKLAYAESDRGTLIVRRGLAGGELYRIERAARPPAERGPRAPPGSEASDLARIEGIGPRHAASLSAIGVRTLHDLRHADPHVVRRVTGATEGAVERWIALARLLSIEAVAPTDATRLVTFGVRDVEDLGMRKPDEIADRLGIPLDLAARWVLEARARAAL